MAGLKDKALLEYLVIAGVIAAGIAVLFFLLRDSFDLIFSTVPVPLEELRKL